MPRRRFGVCAITTAALRPAPSKAAEPDWLRMALIAQLPEFIAWFAGLVLALVNWRRHPRAAPLIVLAMLILITLRLVAGYVTNLLPVLLGGPAGPTAAQLGAALTLSACAQSAIAATAWAMVLAAVFGRRARGE